MSTINMISYAMFLHLIIYLDYNIKWGIIVRRESFWIGCHYSNYNKRYCLNIIPCFTIWWIKIGGKIPKNL